jgi:hypothetical protein
MFCDYYITKKKGAKESLEKAQALVEIGTVQGHPILLEALRHAFTTRPSRHRLFLFVKKIHEIIQQHCLLYPDSLVGILSRKTRTTMEKHAYNNHVHVLSS